MKKLFEFTLDKEVVETVTNKEKNDKGETVTTEKEVKKTVQQKIFLRKPTRSLYDGAELFYGVKLSEGIKAGLLTRALLAKRFSNDGGVLSEDEKDRYADLYLKLYETQLDAEKLGDAKGKKDQKKLVELMEQSAEVRRQLTDFEMQQSALFEQTAENRARNKTILWWVLQLSHFEDEEEKSSVVFEGDNFEEKLDSYDKLEESEEEFNEELLQKLIYYVSFWYVGKAQSQEDFDEILKNSEEEPTEEEPVKEEPVKEEPVKEEPVKEEPVKEEPVKEDENLKEKPRDKVQEK